MKGKVPGVWLAQLFMAVSISLNGQKTERVPIPSSLGAMAWLVGDWHAVSQSAEGLQNPLKASSRFRSELGGRMMTLTMSQAGRDFMSGMFAYDGAKKAVVFWYVVTDLKDAESEESGTLATGNVKIEQDSSLLDYSATRLDGATGHLQTRIQRMDADHYRWGVYADYPGEGIQKLNEIVFARGL